MPHTPRRRWASRRPRPMQKRGKKQGGKQRPRPKVAHKPRLVRRYKRGDGTKARPAAAKHGDGPASSALADKGKVKISGAGHNDNDVAADSKTTTHRPAIAVVTGIPNPTPDTGVITPAASTGSILVAAGSPLLGASSFDSATSGLSVINGLTSAAPVASTSTVVIHTTVSSFSPLPPLPSFGPTSVTSVGLRPAAIPSSSSSSISAASPSDTSSPVDSTPRTLSAALVILCSVGGALLLLGFCIVVKMCAGPRKRIRPKPSLPVIKSGDADEDFYETKESPIFGGEERMSTAIAATGPTWNWIQYPHTKISGPQAAPDPYACPAQQAAQGQAYPGEAEYNPESRFNLATRAPSPPHTSTNNVPAVFQDVGPPAPKRMSRQSLSFYAPSPGDAPLHNIIEETESGDSGANLTRSRAKTSSRRFSQPALEERKQRNSTMSFVGLAYDGDETVSPSPAEYGHVIQDTPILNSDFAGRARVKSGYFAAGTYPRMSTLPTASYSIATATRINVGQRNSLSKEKANKRPRDTQALTHALGLATPRPGYAEASPQPSLYPDDSVSVVDARRMKRSVSQRKAVPDMPVMAQQQQQQQQHAQQQMQRGGGSSETLMGMSFGVSQMSLSGLALGPVSERDEEAGSMESSHSARSVRGAADERAPRVPSPPPLPTLAQMGLQRSNPEAYDNYRSPTYSLYGLYQTADRKSYAERR